jgi:hypothetical protein
MLPTTASGRFRFMFVLLLSILVVGIAMWFVDVLNEPARLGGFAI